MTLPGQRIGLHIGAWNAYTNIRDCEVTVQIDLETAIHFPYDRYTFTDPSTLTLYSTSAEQALVYTRVGDG